MKSSYLALWLLLAGALVIFLTVSFADDITLGSYTVKKAPFAETLLPDTLATETGQFTSAEHPVAADTVPEIVQIDSLPKTILLFGDSMTMNIALRLARYAKQNGHDMHAINWDSSNTKIWAETDTLSYYIKKLNPDFIFISLGSNEVYFKDPFKRQPNVRRILATIGDVPYIWIGPPTWDNRTAINDMLEATCRPGTYFKSSGMEFKRKKDKIHPTREASALWVDSIMRWMPKSAHPILADYPNDSLGKVNSHIIFLKALNK
ncbi:MAG: SGNH/GDSL hydrolase family protein [Muribaculaceae bacterium]|nr:hypothetical protein [Bacteroides sp.]MDE6227998.1 SGNH/GDSL hydrolase family protein [Muribaculaceae bacterium]